MSDSIPTTDQADQADQTDSQEDRIDPPSKPPGRSLDSTSWAYAVIVALGFILAWFLSNALEDGWAVAAVYWPQLGRPRPDIATYAAIGIAIFTTIIGLSRKSWVKFLQEVVSEVAEIVWPTRAEVRAATIVVVVMTIICSLLLSGIDLLWSSITDIIYDFELS